jgi:very-short-patch-repair endonuclease
VEAYLAGEAVLSIAHRHGISRSVIDRQLREAGVVKRSRSEQNMISARRQPAEERKRRAAGAHAAKRGRPNRPEPLRQAALTRQALGAPESPGEARLLKWLEERGERPGIQTAIGSYNVDLTVAAVAVEVLGGEWHARKPSHGPRTKALLDAGWHVLFIWDTPTFPMTAASADYVIAFAQETSRDPSAIREYRVIRGDGEIVARGSLDDYQLTYVPPARYRMSRSAAGRLGAAARWG